MGITKKPVDPRLIEGFILGAPDAAPKAPVAAAPTVAAPKASGTPAPTVAATAVKASEVAEPRAGGRKKPISLTIAPDLLSRLDRVATRRGISRASAFALAVSNFVESEERGAQ